MYSRGSSLGSRVLLLRSKAIAQAWGGAAILLGLLLVQQFVGWPLHRRIAFGRENLMESKEAVLEFRLPLKEAPTQWDAAYATVTADGHALPRATSLNQIKSEPADGWYLTGRSIYVRTANPTALGAREGFAVTLLWQLTPRKFWGSIGAFLALTALLAFGRNPFLLRAGSQARAALNPRVTGRAAFAVAVIILLAALALRIGGLSFPAISSDTKDYLKPALQFASGHGLTASPDRPFAYPLAVGLILRVASDLRAVVAGQALATLLTAAVMGLLIWQAGRRLFPGSAWQGVAQWAGVAAFGFFALNESIIEREWAILPEAWATIYFGIQLWLAWKLSSGELTKARAIPCYLAFCAAGCLLFFTKPNWGLALAALPLPLAIAGALRGSAVRGFLVWSTAGVGLFAVVFGAAFGIETACTTTSTLASLDQRSRVLICWHVPMVRPILEERLRTQPGDPYRAALSQVAQVLDEALALAKQDGPGAYPQLGYDGDKLFYVGFKKADLYWKLPKSERTTLFNDLFMQALRQNPGMYVRKVASQMAQLPLRPYGALTARAHGPAIVDREHIEDSLAFSEQYLKQSPDLSPALRAKYAATLRDARATLEQSWPLPQRYGLSSRISVLFEFLRATFRWSIGVPIIICGVAAAWPRWRRRVDWKALAPVLGAAIWATASAILCALSSSIAQALEIQRYIDLFMPLTLFCHFLWPLIALSLVFSLLRKQPTPTAPQLERPQLEPVRVEEREVAAVAVAEAV